MFHLLEDKFTSEAADLYTLVRRQCSRCKCSRETLYAEREEGGQKDLWASNSFAYENTAKRKECRKRRKKEKKRGGGRRIDLDASDSL